MYTIYVNNKDHTLDQESLETPVLFSGSGNDVTYSAGAAETSSAGLRVVSSSIFFPIGSGSFTSSGTQA